MTESRLAVVNLYELKATAEQFGQAAGALSRRGEAEGNPGILSYRFFVNPSENTARGIIDYLGVDAWIEHHEIAMGWPEMAAMHAAATLVEVTFLGRLTAEIADWIEGSALTAQVRSGNSLSAGSQRSGLRPGRPAGG